MLENIMMVYACNSQEYMQDKWFRLPPVLMEFDGLIALSIGRNSLPPISYP